MIIQTGFAQGDNFGMLGQFAKRRAQIRWRFAGIRRMPADDCKDIGELLRQLDCATAAFEIGPDADDFHDARCAGSGDCLGQFFCKIRIIQVRVGIEESGRHKSVEFVHLSSGID